MKTQLVLGVALLFGAGAVPVYAQETPAAVSANAEAVSDTQIQDYFRNGDWDIALTALRNISDAERRQNLVLDGFDLTPASTIVTDDQVIEILRLYDGVLDADYRAIYASLLAEIVMRNRIALPKKIYEAFENGVGPYGGKTAEGRQLAYNLMGESVALMELQYQFLPDVKALIKAGKFSEAMNAVTFQYIRAEQSGRQADAEACFDCVMTALNDSALSKNLAVSFEAVLLDLSNRIPENVYTPAFMAYFNSNGERSSRLANKMFQRLQQSINAANNKKGAEKFAWIPDFERLNTICKDVAARKIDGWNDNAKNSFLRQVALLWRDRMKQIVRANDEALRRYSQRYNSNVTENDLMRPRDAIRLYNLAPEGVWNALPSLKNDQISMIEAKIELLTLGEKFREAAQLIGEIKKMNNAKSQLMAQSERLLDRMVVTLNPNSVVNNNADNMYQRYTQRTTISMTRLRQKHNLATFREVLSMLDSMGIRPETEKIIGIFDAVHSRAEVYRYDDIVAVFGAPSKMSEQEVFLLGQLMMTKLSGDWANIDAQNAASTGRTEKQVNELARGGYETLDRVLREACAGEAGKGYLIHALRGSIIYQWAAFLEKNKIDENQIVKLQSEALTSLQNSADRYVKLVPQLYESNYDLQVYEFWFSAFMVAGANKTSVKDRPNLAAIRKSIDQMPRDAAMKHLDKLAATFIAALPRQPAGERQAYLESCLKIIDGTDVAETFKERLNYYKGLVDEAKLVVTPASFEGQVSNDQIGLLISLEYTPELGREAGSFNGYLQSGGARNTGAYYYGGYEEQSPTVATRENFEMRIKESLQEQFDVISVTFAPADIRPVALNQEWNSLPMAYVILKPKSPTIDRIPSVQLDLEFADNGEKVVLPIESRPVTLQLSDPKKQPIPPHLNVKQTVNFVDLADNRVVLKIRAEGDEMIGCYETIFPNKTFEGFEVSDMEDHQVTTKDLKLKGGKPSVTFERTWTLYLKPSNPEQLPAEFKFIAPIKADSCVTMYTHDVNFVDCDGVCPVSRYTITSSAKRWMVIGFSSLLALVLVGAGLIIGIKRARKTKKVEHKRMDPGPFALHRMLCEIAEKQTLSAQDKTELLGAIKRVEDSCFAKETATLGAAEIAAIYKRWKTL